MSNWWRDDSTKGRAASVAILDIDRFGHLNKQWGSDVGDKIISSVANLLGDIHNVDHGLESIARFAGETFVMLYADEGTRSAATSTEKVRQTIAATRFSFGEEQIELNVSCGVTEFAEFESVPDLFARLQRALREAKKTGRNRSCLHDGNSLTNIEPIEFKISERLVEI